MLIAEFGSKHNGCASHYSDRDLLIVSNDWEKINSLKNYYKNIGFSVTSFHTDKANYLAKQGSLFFKHVIDESVLIYDDLNTYNQLSNNWSPKNNYNGEIESNVDLLELVRFVPQSKYSNNYLLDMLIISIRNILIRRIAESGEYVFDWENIAKVAFKYGCITYRDIEIISLSRKLKNRYRMGIYDEISRGLIDGLLSILNSLQREKIKLNYAKKNELLFLPDRFNNGSYKQLKALEAICCYYSFSPSMNHYIELVKDPNYVCATRALTNKSSRFLMHRNNISQ